MTAEMDSKFLVSKTQQWSDFCESKTVPWFIKTNSSTRSSVRVELFLYHFVSLAY